MNISYRWLKDLVPGMDLSPEALAEHLALRGAPVEGMTSPGEALRDIVVAKVLEAGRHPSADRLSLCLVDGGAGPVSVVCGAPNVQAGRYYPFAPVGAVLPGDFKIKKTKIRGEISEGMLCSAKELGLGTDHTGILELPGEYQPGQPFVEALGLDDVTLDVEITANRGDLLSHLGVAREVASEGSGSVQLPDLPGDPGLALEYLQDEKEAAGSAATIRIDDPELCHRYLGAVIRGVRVGPSPSWLQERLRGAGARPINNVVDATNYVMLELGQPLHAFDLARLADQTIIVRRAKGGETSFTTLDGEDRALSTDMLMICDARRPVAVAGVMGGLESEVEDETTDILLECALFEPRSIRATRRALGMSTDASYRFERGVDPEGLPRALERAVALIVATAGGEVDGPVLDVCPRPFEAAVVPLRLERIEKLLGVSMTSSQVRGYLEPLGFTVEGENGGVLDVRVPGFRAYDVTREVDLIEEVARTHGYDAFPADLGAYRPGTVPDHPLFRLEDDLRNLLAGAGLFEAQTPAFVPEGEGDVRVSNPLNTQEPVVRRVLLPSLLRRVSYNFARGNRDVRLFELGTSFRSAGPGEPPREEPHLAVALTGRRRPPHWARPEETMDIWDIKGLAERVMAIAYPEGGRVEPDGEPPSTLDPALALTMVDPQGHVVGWCGRVRADAVDAPVWADDVFALEVTLPAEGAPREPVAFSPLPAYPASERDLAVLVPADIPAADVLALVRSRAGKLLEEAEIFDVYQGKGVAAGTRSLAVRLRFRAPDRTLKDKEVDRAVQNVLRRLKEELGVEHRG